MSEDGTFYICEGCKDRVEPDTPGVVRARKLIRTVDLTGTDVIEGEGVFFHERHYPVRSSRYRRSDARSGQDTP